MFRGSKSDFAKILTLTVLLVLHYGAMAQDDSTITTVSITAKSIFSIEFYTDENIAYSTTVPFSNIDATRSLVYATGRAENDGKSDTGVVCISNLGVPWYLNIQGTFSEGIPKNCVKYYYSQPWNRNTGDQTGGSLTYDVDWRAVPKESSTVYTSGEDDTVNAPFGTLSTLSFAVDPKGLSSEQTYTAAITYTMTTTP